MAAAERNWRRVFMVLDVGWRDFGQNDWDGKISAAEGLKKYFYPESFYPQKRHHRRVVNSNLMAECHAVAEMKLGRKIVGRKISAVEGLKKYFYPESFYHQKRHRRRVMNSI
jgi:hypothetical protein